MIRELCSMWTKKADGFRSSSASLCDDSWEERAFAEDAAGHHGGYAWPPRSYHCSFCGREFRSAQALGGHMNVHRRDRARLKQSPNHDTQQTTCNPPQTSVTYCLGVFNHPYPFFKPQVCAFLANPCPSLNPNRSSSELLPEKETCEEQILFPRHSSLSTVLDENNEIRSSVSKSDELQSRSIDEEPIESLRVHARPDQPSMNCCKRRRIDSSSMSFLSELRSIDHETHVQSEIIGLDLELRLGLLAEDEVK